MAKMTVKLFLDLVNRLSGPAKAARKDLAGVKSGADALKNARGGDKLASDLGRVGANAAKAKRDIMSLRSEVKALNTTRVSPKLAAERQTFLRNAHGKARGKDEAGGGNTLLAGGGGKLIAGYAGVQAARAGYNKSVGVAVSRETAMANVKKKVDLPDGETFNGLEKQISQMAIAYGRTYEEVAGIVAEAGAAGIAFKDLAEFTKLSTKASIGWDMSTQEAASQLAKIRAATQWTIPELELFADKVNALGDGSASKEKDIIEMFQRSGAAAKEAGVSFDASLGFLTAMNSVGIAPEVASRSFNAMTMKLRTAAPDNKVGEGLKMLGLDAKKVAKGMKTDSIKTMLEMFDKLEKSPKSLEAAMKMFGQDWVDEIMRAKGGIKEVIKNLEIVSNPVKHRGSLEKGLNVDLATTGNHLARLKVLTDEVGERLARWALPGINEKIEKLISLLDGVDKAVGEKNDLDTISGKIAREEPLSPAELRRATALNGLDQAVREKKAVIDKATVDKTVMKEQSGRFLTGTDQKRASSAVDALEQKKKSLEQQISTLETRRTDPLAFGSVRDGAQRAITELERQKLELQGRIDQMERTIKRSSDAGRQGPAADANDRLSTGEAETKARTELHAKRKSLNSLSDIMKDGKSREDIRKMMLDLETGGGRDEGDVSRKMPDRKGAKNSGLKEKIKAAMTVDLAPEGGLIMDTLAAGLAGGQGKTDGAATAAGTGIKTALSGVDLNAAGLQMMGSLAAGITAGGAQAVAAAENVASRVRTTLASAGGKVGGSARASLNDSLHDGVAG